LEEMATAHGAGYVDLMRPFSEIKDSQDLFFVVDGHITAQGQAIIGRSVTAKLLDGSVPAFAHCGDTRH
jgi:hypothetical protein